MELNSHGKRRAGHDRLAHGTQKRDEQVEALEGEDYQGTSCGGEHARAHKYDDGGRVVLGVLFETAPTLSLSEVFLPPALFGLVPTAPRALEHTKRWLELEGIGKEDGHGDEHVHHHEPHVLRIETRQKCRDGPVANVGKGERTHDAHKAKDDGQTHGRRDEHGHEVTLAVAPLRDNAEGSEFVLHRQHQRDALVGEEQSTEGEKHVADGIRARVLAPLIAGLGHEVGRCPHSRGDCDEHEEVGEGGEGCEVGDVGHHGQAQACSVHDENARGT
mmetsp:Transcript_17107/g.46278  ORF Transcript_17107/g.46278 Transcript_17107/m.46278 type:complete len:274 (-) Transcript_17107:616-1437(-)